MSTDLEKGASSLFWDAFTIKDDNYIIGYDGLILTKVIEDNNENSVTSNKIHADGSCRYYFELTIENNPGNLDFGIYAYDNDQLYKHFKYDTTIGIVSEGIPYTSIQKNSSEIVKHTIIGCGLDYNRSTIFFTDNGKYVGIIKSDEVIKTFVLSATLKMPGMRVRLNDGKSPFAFNIDNVDKISPVSISLDGNYIASFNILNETVSLWSRPTNSFNLDEKVLIGNCEIDIKKMIDISQEKFDGKFGLTVSTKMLPYNYLQFKGIFIILFYQPEENESEEVKPIILYKEHKDIKRLEYSYPVCLKSVKGIAEFLVDGMTLVVKNKTTFYVVSISSWPWTLIRKLNHVNIAESIITFNPSTFKSYILLPQCSKKFLSMINVRAGYSSPSHIIAKSCVGYKMIISSKGDLLAFENGSIIERQTGLNIARHNVADMKDFAFVHDDRHLLKICFNELSMSATLIDARSGIKLATVMLPKLESDYLKHIRLIKDGRIIAVILRSGFSSLVVEEWNWEKAFCIQSTKYLNSFTYNNIDWPDNLINSYEITNKSLKKKALSIHNDKENYSLVFSCYNVKCPTGAIFFHLDEESAIMVTPDCIFLFWEKDGDFKCLVWLLYKSKIKAFSCQYMDHISDTRVLQFCITCKDNKKLYTLLPLDLVIEGQSLTAEWMQSSCHYIEQQKSNNISQIHLLTIKQYIKCNAFNNTMAIYDLINCNADEIVKEILKYDHYIPTIVCYKKNPLIKAIKMHKTSLTQQIIDYCWHQCSNKDEPGFMSVVVDVLPQLATQYPHMLSTLLKQLTFAKIPTSWEINKPKKDKSSYKNLWTHKLDGSISFGINEDYETDDMMNGISCLTTYCYVPLPGLCHYSNVTKLNNPNFSKLCIYIITYLFLDVRELSPFAKLTLLQSFEAFQSKPFEAIVTFKWNAFARSYFLVFLFYYLAYFILFAAAIHTNNSYSESFMITAYILGVFLAILWIIRAVNFTTYIELIAYVLPVIAGSQINSSPELRSISILFLWIYFVAQLRVFKGIGIFIAVYTHIFIKIRWLLLLITLILLAFAHPLMVLSSETPNSGMKFYQSLKNAWLMLLNDYSSLDSQTENYLSDILKITFSFSTTIIIFNILIALMNNTYKKIYKNARTAWVMQRAEVIVNIEILLIHYFNRKLFYGDCFPWSIIYKALTEEVDEWSKEKGNIQTTDEVTNEMKNEINKIKGEINKMMTEKMTHELNELRKFISAELQKIPAKEKL
ncbi:hypothetical protein RhiirB3_449710 [Rhizophagus irregularis]|nr:hypothetical protein RhiirB3_449710 [Rhizophagus irregularis]